MQRLELTWWKTKTETETLKGTETWVHKMENKHKLKYKLTHEPKHKQEQNASKAENNKNYNLKSNRCAKQYKHFYSHTYNTYYGINVDMGFTSGVSMGSHWYGCRFMSWDWLGACAGIGLERGARTSLEHGARFDLRSGIGSDMGTEMGSDMGMGLDMDRGLDMDMDSGMDMIFGQAFLGQLKKAWKHFCHFICKKPPCHASAASMLWQVILSWPNQSGGLRCWCRINTSSTTTDVVQKYLILYTNIAWRLEHRTQNRK